MFRQKNFPKKRFSQSFFASKILFSLKELSWVKIQLKYNLGSWSLAFRLNLKKYDKTGSFRWFSLVDFCFFWVGLVFLTLTAVLGGNSTYTKPRRLKFCMPAQIKEMGDQIFWDQIMFSSSALIRLSSRLTVSAWVSPSSTPACLIMELIVNSFY